MKKTMSVLPGLACALSLALGACSSTPPLAEREVSGRILDGRGDPIVGAEVTGYFAVRTGQEPSAWTDHDGQFRLRIPEETKRITVYLAPGANGEGPLKADVDLAELPDVVIQR